MASNNWVYGLPENQRPGTIADMVRMTAEHYGVDPALAYTVFNKESSGIHQDDRGVTTGPPNPTTEQRARGLFQVLPTTATGYGLNADDPLDNIETGIRYLKEGLDANKGSARGALAYYYGGPDPRQHGPFTQRYVDEAMPQLLIQHRGQELQRARTQQTIDAGKGKEGGIRPASPAEQRGDWMMEHFPRISAVASTMFQAHDPRTREGRENLAGTTGDIAGSAVGAHVGRTSGAIAGTAAEPGGGTVAGGLAGAYSGRRIGGPIGAFVAGAGEHALLEETGLGDKLARYFGYKPQPEQALDPTSNPVSRTLHAGYSQAWPAALGQGAAAVVPAVTKRVVQSSIARGAAESFEKANMRDMNVLYDQLDKLRTEARNLTAARNQAGRTLRQGVSDRLQGLRDDLTAKMGDVGTKGTRAVADAMDVADAEQRVLRGARDVAPARLGEAKDVGAQGVQSARDAARASVDLAKARADAAMSRFVAGHEAGPPSGLFTEPEAGEATAAAFAHGKETVLTPAGKAVTAASEAVQTPVDYRPLKEEARGMLERLLRPRDAARLAQTAEESAALAGGATPDAARAAAAAATPPTTNAELDTLLSQIDDAQAAEIAKHPAMRTIGEILAGPDSGPHLLGHQWKSDLGHALDQSGAYGNVTNSVAANVTKKLTGTLRTALRDPGYDAATKAYEQLAPFFYNGPHAKLVAQIANREVGPEAIVQAIKPDQSTFTKQLVDGLLAHGGDAGKAAVERLQSSWWHRNVLQGGVEKLGDTITKLEQRPEFMEALFGSTPAGKQLVANTKTIAAALEKKAAEGAMGKGMAEATGHWSVRGAERTRDAGIQSAKDVSAQEIEAATARVGKAKQGIGDARVARADALEQQRLANIAEQRAAERAGDLEVEAGRRANEGARNATAQEMQDHRTTMRRRAQGTPEERAFERSSLGRPVESPGEALGNLIIHRVAPQLGWLKLFKGAKTDDILRYAASSPKLTQLFVKALVALPLHEPIPQVVGATIRSPGGVSAAISGKSKAQRDKDDAAYKARWSGTASAPPAPPR